VWRPFSRVTFLKKKILLIFGTRPEAIKMAPLAKALQKNAQFDVITCVTAQHRQMLDQVLVFFNIRPDVDLDLMQPNQTLSDFAAHALRRLSSTLSEIKPDLILVQGDTTTAFAGALAAFYQKIPVGHVEAGLRTGDLCAPFPEEANRHLISVLARWHFAPTKRAETQLLSEGIPQESVFITGNTVIDALYDGLALLKKNDSLRQTLDVWFQKEISRANQVDSGKSRVILITGHRRENFGEGFESICSAIRELALRHPKDIFIYPVHLNPNVQAPVQKILQGLPNVSLLPPVEYPKMLYLLSKTYMILTDSGGIQEEAPSLKIPTLVMRDKTERPEGVTLGALRLVGNTKAKIVEEASELLENISLYRRMQIEMSPYGDGKAAQRIVGLLQKIS